MSYAEILCGLSYHDVITAAMDSPNLRAAARRLGVSERQLRTVVKRRGMQHWFRREKPRPRCVSREDVEHAALVGSRWEAADVLGISESYLKDLINLWGLHDLFAWRPEISKEDLERCARLKMTRKEISLCRGIPYNRVATAVRRYGLEHLFPGSYGGRKWVESRN